MIASVFFLHGRAGVPGFLPGMRPTERSDGNMGFPFTEQLFPIFLLFLSIVGSWRHLHIERDEHPGRALT
jgi:hypothetical protein